MAVDSLQDWKDELEDLSKVLTTIWAPNFAEWYADRIVSMETDSTATTNFAFNFAEAAFAAELIVLAPADQVTGINNFADAWETAILATTPTATAAAGFDSVSSIAIDAASIALGKLKILELIAAVPEADAQDSLFPVKFRDATLLLTVTISGTISGSPGSVPGVTVK